MLLDIHKDNGIVTTTPNKRYERNKVVTTSSIANSQYIIHGSADYPIKFCILKGAETSEKIFSCSGA